MSAQPKLDPSAYPWELFERPTQTGSGGTVYLVRRGGWFNGLHTYEYMTVSGRRPAKFRSEKAALAAIATSQHTPCPICCGSELCETCATSSSARKVSHPL